MTERRGFGLYVHWPFCQAKCPYCDFNSHVAANVDQSRWRAALASEVQRSVRETEGRVLDSIFFGGGTPSLMEPETVATVIDAARAAWPSSNSIEITLEANPNSVEAARFREFADAGVNRVSIGVQSLRDDHLRALGRLHNAREALDAVAIARDVFSRVSFDLIYARQNQSLSDWEAELSEALALKPDHLSLYQLTIEDGTAFGDRFARGRLAGLPDEDLAADMYEITQSLTEAVGLPAYEISNHARPGQESRHNLIYWRSGDWVGIGPGAHGRLTLANGRVSTEAHRAPGAWIDAVESHGSGECALSVLSPQDQFEESVMMGLRLVEGIGSGTLDRLNVNKVKELVDISLLEIAQVRIRATPSGRPVLNYILRELLA